jgi:hypothetical protein
MDHFIKSVFLVTCMALTVVLCVAAPVSTAQAASVYPAKPVMIIVATRPAAKTMSLQGSWQPLQPI